MADSILRTESHRVLVRRWNEIGDLLHGKGIANIENASPCVEPGKNGNLAIVRGIKRFGLRMSAEAPSPAAIISRIFRHAKRRNGPWCGFVADVHQKRQVRPRAVPVGTRRAM